MTLVQFTVEQWADQEQELIEKFVQFAIMDSGDELTLSAGEWDDWFQAWHNDSSQKTPEESEVTQKKA